MRKYKLMNVSVSHRHMTTSPNCIVVYWHVGCGFGFTERLWGDRGGPRTGLKSESVECDTFNRSVCVESIPARSAATETDQTLCVLRRSDFTMHLVAESSTLPSQRSCCFSLQFEDFFHIAGSYSTAQRVDYLFRYSSSLFCLHYLRFVCHFFKLNMQIVVNYLRLLLG